MGYRVAWDVERTTNEAYMVAAGQNGIPCCFLVDKKGKIAYIGHPAFVDPAVEGVLDGSWDPDKGMKQIEEAKKDLQKLYRIGDPKDAIKAIDKFVKDNPALAGMVADLRYEMHLRAGSKDAQKYGEELYEKAVAQKDAVKLNELAWRLVAPDAEIEKPDLDFALRAAQKADELTGGEDASILDTLARVHFVRGDVAKAIELQKRAVEHADGEMKDQLEKTLADYEKKAG